jgi:hypothetical protein
MVEFDQLMNQCSLLDDMTLYDIPVSILCYVLIGNTHDFFQVFMIRKICVFGDFRNFTSEPWQDPVHFPSEVALFRIRFMPFWRELDHEIMPLVYMLS